MYKSREMKHKQFISFCKPNKSKTVLDVGVQNEDHKDSDNFLVKNYQFPEKITGLGVEELSDFNKKYPKVKTITYDGTLFPFRDNQFDSIWSNAVIEHVGVIERQQLFLNEMIRVAKNKVFFTTPNRGFPVEIHTRAPIVHWLPRAIANKFYTLIGKQWAAGDYMFLLYKRDVIKLLENAKKELHFEYKLIENKFLGLTATFSILITK
jgi:ubiquinone/menaquinone biosynthesis C-methylase UbiE